MGKRTLVLVIALVLAAVAAFAVWQYLTNVEGEIRADITEVQVWRADRDIDTGTPGETVRGNEFVKESVALAAEVDFEGSKILCGGPEGNAASELCSNNPRDIRTLLSGTVAAGPISKGQLITTDMFVTPAELNSISISESIPVNKVAISLRTDEDASVGGFIRPGDRVNVLASATIQLDQLVDLVSNPELRDLIFDSGLGGGGTPTTTAPPIPGGPEQPSDPLTEFAESFPTQLQFTQTVLQDVEVLAVGPDTRNEATDTGRLGTGLEPQGSQVIVLEVTFDQAEKIEFARQYTSVSFSLLPKDQPYTPGEARGVLVDDLFSLLERIVEELEQAGASLGS